MGWQALIVAVMVSSCLCYAVWALMTAAMRRNIAARLLRFRWLTQSNWLQRAARAPSSGCGCTGCDSAAAPAPARGTATILWHARRSD